MGGFQVRLKILGRRQAWPPPHASHLHAAKKTLGLSQLRRKAAKDPCQNLLHLYEFSRDSYSCLMVSLRLVITELFKRFRVIALDYPGFGPSDAATGFSCKPSGYWKEWKHLLMLSTFTTSASPSRTGAGLFALALLAGDQN